MTNIEDIEADDVAIFQDIQEIIGKFIAAMENKIDQLSFRYVFEDNIKQSVIDVLSDCGIPTIERIEVHVEQARIEYEENLRDDYDEQRAEHRREMRELGN